MSGKQTLLRPLRFGYCLLWRHNLAYPDCYKAHVQKPVFKESIQFKPASAVHLKAEIIWD